VVDALNFQKTIERVGRNSHQIRVADTIVLKKRDLAIESILQTRRQLLIINPFARIIETLYCDFEFFKESVFRMPVSLIINEQNQSSIRPVVGTVVVKLMKPISVKNLDLFIEKFRKTTYRIKGYLDTINGPVAIQTSFEQTQIKSVSQNSYHTEIVITGPQIDQKDLQKEFEKLCYQN